MAPDDTPIDLEYRPFSLPLSTPLETAAGSIETRDGFLIRVSDGDAVGIGEATPLSGWTESLAACEDGLERAAEAIRSRGVDGNLEGVDGNLEDIDDTLESIDDALDAVDDRTAARHGVSLALADLRATRDSVPLYDHLGVPSRVGRVPVNATIGDRDPTETVESARSAVDRGFDCLKLKVGARSLESDVERVRRVREAVGPDVELRADANGAWTREQATLALETVAAHDVTVVEQPLPADDLEGHAALGGGDVTVALDEGLIEHGVDEVLRHGAADALVVKPMALGGVDVAREIAAWAAERDVPSIVSTTVDGVVARTGAVHLAAAIPDVPACGLATGDRLETDLATDSVLFERGAAVVPQAKGLGVRDAWVD